MENAKEWGGIFGESKKTFKAKINIRKEIKDMLKELIQDNKNSKENGVI